MRIVAAIAAFVVLLAGLSLPFLPNPFADDPPPACDIGGGSLGPHTVR